MDKNTNVGPVQNPGESDETQNVWENINAPISSKTVGKRKRLATSQGKAPYASFFRDNRTPENKSKLEFIQPADGEFDIQFDETDTVVQARGFCILGYAIGLRPTAYILGIFVKNRGKNVRFEIHKNGWITSHS